MNVTRLKIPAIRAAIESHVWAIHPDKLNAILELIELRALGGSFTADEITARIGEKPRAAGRVQGSVAVLPLHGVISARMNLMSDISGGTSAELFGKEFDALVANDDIGAIVLDVDSPGGSVEGTMEVAAKVLAARGVKPVYAVANGQMCSAAYWVSSGALECIATPSAVDIGNIGVYTVRRDLTAADEKDGIKYEVIGAGKYKGEGNPHTPITDEERAFTSDKVQEFYGAFVGHVAKALGVSAKDVRSGYGEGRALTAKQAKDAGLVHRIATLDDVIGKLVGTKPKGASTARAESDAPLTLVASDALGSPSGIQASTGASLPVHLTSSAPQARMVPVENGNTAAGGAAPQDLAAVRAAIREEESKRVRDITALCSDHKVASDQTQTYINGRMSVQEVSYDILTQKRNTTTGVNGASQPVVRVGGVALRSERDPSKGFASHREFLTSVIENRSRDFSQIKDERLRGLAVRDANDSEAGGEVAFMLPTGLLATVGSDEQGNYGQSTGGFAGNIVTRLPGLLQTGFDGDPLAGRSQDVPMASPTVEILARTDKNHTSSVSGGFTVARKAETAAAAASRMSMEKVSLRASSLFGLAYATEELLSDSPMSFAAIIEAGFRDQFGAHILNEKIRGLGDGEYLGVLNAGATVEVSKESNQIADTFVTQNALKMRARCWGYGNAVWVANPELMPQLGVLSVGVGTAGALVYQNSVREDLPDMLLGRPLFYSEFASAKGDVGDIILVNMSQYLEGTYQPIQSASSIHVRFANHEQAFKFWTRNAGQPWWRSALTPFKGSDTLSPFVTLAAR